MKRALRIQKSIPQEELSDFVSESEPVFDGARDLVFLDVDRFALTNHYVRELDERLIGYGIETRADTGVDQAFFSSYVLSDQGWHIKLLTENVGVEILVFTMPWAEALRAMYGVARLGDDLFEKVGSREQEFTTRRWFREYREMAQVPLMREKMGGAFINGRTTWFEDFDYSVLKEAMEDVGYAVHVGTNSHAPRQYGSRRNGRCGRDNSGLGALAVLGGMALLDD